MISTSYTSLLSIDYLFNSNPLTWNHHRSLLQDDPQSDNDNDNLNNNANDNNNNNNKDKLINGKKKFKSHEIFADAMKNRKQGNNINPEDILHSQINKHNRPNYISPQELQHKAHGHTNERVHVNSNSFFFVLLTVIGCQLGIWYWRKNRPRSFFLFTLLGLWLFPIIISIQLRYWRMIFVWSIFSFVCGILVNMSRSRPMNRKTPRYLYSWFYTLYKFTNILSIVGYMLFLADFFGLGILIFGPHPTAEREYRSKLIHHQHEAHLHAIQGDQDLESVKLEMQHERDELHELQHGYHHIHFSDIGIYLLFYGLYYGVLARDTAQLCADWISSALGFFNPSGFPRRRVPTNICAVCNNPLIDHNIGIFNGIGGDSDGDLTPTDKDSTTDRRLKLMKQRRRMDEKTLNAQNENKRGFPWNLCSFANTKQDEEIQINCGHTFHGFCIRGWIMIGKRDVCPVCKEKVNLKGIFANPWQKQDRMWSQLLDGVRYLMVWNPVIVLAANLVFNVSGLSFTSKNKQPLATN